MRKAHGIDISKHESFYKPKENPPCPVDFVIQRLSYGLMKDEKINELSPIVQGVPIRGAFHYASSNVDWKTQAEFFLDLAGNKYQFLAWDVERSYNVGSSSFIYGTLRALEFLEDNSSAKILLYTNPDVWGDWYRPIQPDLLKYDLWVAHYWWVRANYWNDPQPNYYKVRGAENMRKDWRLWQYDNNGMGGRGVEFGVGSKGLDLNIYNGSVEEMKSWLKVKPPIFCPTCGQEVKQ